MCRTVLITALNTVTAHWNPGERPGQRPGDFVSSWRAEFGLQERPGRWRKVEERHSGMALELAETQECQP